MSEKRFTSNKRWIAEGTIVDICDNGKVIMQVFDDDNIQNVVDLLNELAEENEKLRVLIDINSVSERTKLERQVDEQQAIINEQNEAIDYLKTVIRYTIPNQMVADVFKYIGEEYE